MKPIDCPDFGAFLDYFSSRLETLNFEANDHDKFCVFC